MLSESVFLGMDMVKKGERDSSIIISAMTAHIQAEPLAKIDYIKIVDCKSMQQIACLDKPALCAMAVYIGKTRLIDNFFTEDV